MKKTFFLIFLSVITVKNLCAVESDYCETEYSYNKTQERDQIDYVKLGGTITTLFQQSSFVPIIGFGRRLESSAVAIDYSAKIGYLKGLTGCDHSVFLYTLPKILVIRYAYPYFESSFLYGAGVSFSGVVNHNTNQTFHGVSLEGTIGYELHRCDSMRSFIELEISQPILAAYRKGVFPSPSIGVSVGMGF